MKDKNGDLTLSKSKVEDTGDLNLEVGTTEELNMLEEMKKSESFSLKDFLAENPSAISSKINEALHWVSVADGWFLALNPILAEDGNTLVRITIAPPKTHKLVVYQDQTDNSKQIILESA